MNERNFYNRLCRIHGRCRGNSEFAVARRGVLLQYSRAALHVLKNNSDIEEYLSFIINIRTKLFPSQFYQRNFQLEMAESFITSPKLYTIYDIIEYCGKHHDTLNELTVLMLVPDFSQFFIECDSYELLEYCRSYLESHKWKVSYDKYESFLKGEDIK